MASFFWVNLCMSFPILKRELITCFNESWIYQSWIIYLLLFFLRFFDWINGSIGIIFFSILILKIWIKYTKKIQILWIRLFKFRENMWWSRYIFLLFYLKQSKYQCSFYVSCRQGSRMLNLELQIRSRKSI